MNLVAARLRHILRVGLPIAVGADTVYSFYRVHSLLCERLEVSKGRLEGP